MKRILIAAIGFFCATCASASAAAPTHETRADVWSILATTGGYYIRTVSPRGDRLTASCQLLVKGRWQFGVTLTPATPPRFNAQKIATLRLLNAWSYTLTSQDGRSFEWSAPSPREFTLFLRRVQGMGWSDYFAAPSLGVHFLSHGSDDPGTISAFSHLCRLPGQHPNAY